MILCIGEILVDRLIADGKSISHVGGAPFNVAVHAAKHGAEVGFFGRVGADKDGEFIKKETAKYLPCGCILQTDPVRKTTVAEVTLDKGERSFRFLRENTADYAFDGEIPFIEEKSLNIVHLGTLMLNTVEGRSFADRVIRTCGDKKIFISSDANFRDGLFDTQEEKLTAMRRVLKSCDVVKLSDEELCELTGEEDVTEGMKRFCPKNLLFVTMGGKGSYAYSSETGAVYAESRPVTKVVDTTGAGDAFFGAVLAETEKFFAAGKQPNREDLKKILLCGNLSGAEAVTREGAVW